MVNAKPKHFTSLRNVLVSSMFRVRQYDGLNFMLIIINDVHCDRKVKTIE